MGMVVKRFIFLLLFLLSSLGSASPPGGLTYVESSTRFLFIPETVADEEVGKWQAAIGGHVNQLSRLPRIILPVVVPGSGGRLLRMDPADYGWPATLWNRLGKDHKAPTVYFGGTKVVAYPVDWFIRNSLTQPDKGVGYYDFIGAATGKDFAQLTGFNPGKEKGTLLAPIKDSGAAPRPRLVLSSLGSNGLVWEAFVSDDPREERNPLTTRPPRLEFDVTEKVGPLPNGFLGFWAATRKGTRRNSVPSFAGRDHTARGKSDTVRVGISCIRCHGQRAGFHTLPTGGSEVAERVINARLSFSQAVAKATRGMTVAQWSQTLVDIWER